MNSATMATIKQNRRTAMFRKARRVLGNWQLYLFLLPTVLYFLIFRYTNEMRAKWLAYGGVEDEWDAYVARLESMGLEEYVEIYQKAYTAAYGK